MPISDVNLMNPVVPPGDGQKLNALPLLIAPLLGVCWSAKSTNLTDEVIGKRRGTKLRREMMSEAVRLIAFSSISDAHYKNRRIVEP